MDTFFIISALFYRENTIYWYPRSAVDALNTWYRPCSVVVYSHMIGRASQPASTEAHTAKTRLTAGRHLLTCVAASDWRKSGITEELLKRLPPVAPVIISATMA